jgi:hypothetical protein
MARATDGVLPMVNDQRAALRLFRIAAMSDRALTLLIRCGMTIAAAVSQLITGNRKSITTDIIVRKEALTPPTTTGRIRNTTGPTPGMTTAAMTTGRAALVLRIHLQEAVQGLELQVHARTLVQAAVVTEAGIKS